MGTLTIWGPFDSNELSTTNAKATISGNNANTASSLNVNRSSLSIAVETADVWIRLQPAATDIGVRKGFPVCAGELWILPTSWWKRMYTGEVSIINAIDGEAPTYYVTEM